MSEQRPEYTTVRHCSNHLQGAGGWLCDTCGETTRGVKHNRPCPAVCRPGDLAAAREGLARIFRSRPHNEEATVNTVDYTEQHDELARILYAASEAWAASPTPGLAPTRPWYALPARVRDHWRYVARAAPAAVPEIVHQTAQDGREAVALHSVALAEIAAYLEFCIADRVGLDATAAARVRRQAHKLWDLRRALSREGE